jgi:hypothetical protein
MKKRNPDISFLVTELNAASDRMTAERRAYLRDYVYSRFPPDLLRLIEELTPIPEDAGKILTQMTLDLREAIKAGVALAIARYSKELKANREAMQIINARKGGGDKGRVTNTHNATTLSAKARAMLNDGMEVPAIAKELGRSIPTVYRYLKPRKPRARSRKA